MVRVHEVWKREWLAPLLDAIYPAKCRLCGARAEDDLACEEHGLPNGLEGARCDRCAARLPPALPDGLRCGSCRRKRPPFPRVLALGEYESGELREWLLALKHGKRPGLADPLGRALGALVMRSEPSSAEALVPVPLHPLRRFERGYDQAHLLAEAVAVVTGLPEVRALRRVRTTVPQGTPGAVSRSANVRAAFAPRARFASTLEGRSVWLVDDVLTSGSTAAECTRVLARAGVKTAGVLVVARAGIERARASVDSESG